MKRIVPDYYTEFHCIAGNCKHSCCKGWEIDIDDESFTRYGNEKRPLGEKIRSVMKTEEDGTHHFVLGKDERCPFLRKDNLCEMIRELGEESLCQICTDHPRFRNFWTGMTETGLGLVCEEAARIILTRKEPMRLVPVKTPTDDLEDDPEAGRGDNWTENRVSLFDFSDFPEDERELLELREELFEILQDRRYPVDARVDEMLETCGIIRKEDYRYEGESCDEFAGEQLVVCLLYRTLPDSLYDGRLLERIYFVADSYRKIRNEWAKKGFMDPETARCFSEKTEYNPDTWGDLSSLK